MKISRIYPYNKTKGERKNKAEVIHARVNGFRHPGSKKAKLLKLIHSKNLSSAQRAFNINALFGLCR